MGCMQMPARNNIIVNFAIAALLKYQEVGPSSKRANNGGVACVYLRSSSFTDGGIVYFRLQTPPIHGGSKDAIRLRKWEKNEQQSRSCFVHDVSRRLRLSR